MAVVHGNPTTKVHTEFPKIMDYRLNLKKNLSRWTKSEVPSFKLVGHLDTDHWTKLKKKHVDFVLGGKIMRELHAADDRHIHLPQKALPEPPGGIQRYYYDQGRKREDLLKRTFNMYQQELLVDDHHNIDKQGKPRRFTALKQPSIYNQRAKNGFQFWMDRDPILNHVSLSSKYTFGAKHTFHGLGNAPRN